MKKTLLTERFQQLAGIKPLYELSMDNFNEGDDIKSKLLGVKDKIMNHPMIDKIANNILKSPNLSKALFKAANMFGIDVKNLNEGINIDDIIDKGIEIGNKASEKQVNEVDTDDVDVSGSALPAFFGVLGSGVAAALGGKTVLASIAAAVGISLGSFAIASGFLAIVVAAVVAKVHAEYASRKSKTASFKILFKNDGGEEIAKKALSVLRSQMISGQMGKLDVDYEGPKSIIVRSGEESEIVKLLDDAGVKTGSRGSDYIISKQ